MRTLRGQLRRSKVTFTAKSSRSAFDLIDEKGVVHENLFISVEGYTQRAPEGIRPFKYGARTYAEMESRLKEALWADTVTVSHDRGLLINIESLSVDFEHAMEEEKEKQDDDVSLSRSKPARRGRRRCACLRLWDTFFN
jgi:hypothetical protein